ncbi:MAG: hypothetical protein QM796_17295 [Chthoniobacteraceae bacterium]
MQTSYLIAEIIVIPLSGWLSRVMSTRWLFAVSAVGFTLTSLLCGLAWDIQSMIVVSRAAGFPGRLDDSDGVHHRVRLFSGPAARRFAAAVVGALVVAGADAGARRSAAGLPTIIRGTGCSS